MITIEVGARVKLRNLPEDLERKFILANNIENPKFRMYERMGFWTGNTPKQIELFQRESGALVLPRGYFQTAIHEIKAASVSFKINDRTVCPVARVPNPGGQLFIFQAQALEKLLKRRSGILEAPPGSGKTNMLLSAIPRLKTNTLILVHTTELLNQTMERARSWLGIEPGVIGGGKEDIQPVTVAMVQTLAKKVLKDSDIASFFGCILTDECHHSPALMWARILQQLPARFKYGFSATCWRKDGLGFLMQRLIGSKTATVSRKEVEAEGKIVRPDVEVVPTEYFYSLEDSSEWTKMITDLVRDPERNYLIKQEVSKRIATDTQALILTDRIEHANLLSRMLQDLSPVLLTGELTKTDRAQAMKKVRKGTQLTIATTHLLGEGIDVPGWDLLFLVTPISGGPKTLQAAGRVTRPAPGKNKAVLVDFLDSRIPMLKAAFKKRQELYAA